MSPVRIIVLALLFYFLYRLLFGSKKPVGRQKSGGHLDNDSPNILVEDPICHTYVVQGQSLSAEKDGKTVYFCSEECRQKFLKQK
jgi:YHS domain-containing protein